jgi:hypothetical protein
MGGCYLPVLIAAAVMWSAVAGPAARAQLSSKPTPRNVVAVINILIRKNAKNTEFVSFGDRRLPPVRVVRGKKEPTRPPIGHGTTQIVGFPDTQTKPVRIMRGTGFAVAEIWLPAAPPVPRANRATADTVSFADRRQRPVTVLRGSPVAVINLDLLAAARGANVALFSAAGGAELDRIAFAVDGLESSHGSDPAMWRADLSGPQGPMQVSAAAALDSGGGDRFDLIQNRLLGRAYLARLYRRYGNWPDTIAAYNWGPGNMDAWIAAGRQAGGFPLEVDRYRDRVLRDGGAGQMPYALALGTGWQIRAP